MADLDVQRAVSTGICASCTVGQTVTSAERCGSCAKTSSTNIQREVLYMEYIVHGTKNQNASKITLFIITIKSFLV